MGLLPKPLVEVGNRPILWHVMQRYALYGFTDFILCLGFGGTAIRRHIRNNRNTFPRQWRIECVDTGLHTQTGGRIKRIQSRIREALFFATYADGVSDIDIQHLLESHRRRGRIGTMTAVHPASQFGEAILDSNGLITRFVEKPKLHRWVNGGFFVFDRRFFRYLREDSVLEKEPLESLAHEHQLTAFRHTGFWCCMDTYKDTLTLNSLCKGGSAPWLRSGP